MPVVYRAMEAPSWPATSAPCELLMLSAGVMLQRQYKPDGAIPGQIRSRW
jgi:hypothetical protein